MTTLPPDATIGDAGEFGLIGRLTALFPQGEQVLGPDLLREDRVAKRLEGCVLEDVLDDDLLGPDGVAHRRHQPPALLRRQARERLHRLDRPAARRQPPRRARRLPKRVAPA